MCEKAIAIALSILKDAEAPFWDKAEAESYLRSEMVRPVIWKAGKAILWRVESLESITVTDKPEKAFAAWLEDALAEA